jgi:AraC-type transcriptional regulator N-terminus
LTHGNGEHQSEWFLIELENPIESQIVEASEAMPLLSLLLRLDMSIVRKILNHEELPEAEPSGQPRRCHRSGHGRFAECGTIATTGDLGNRTARAITWLKDNYAKRLHMEELAGVARMGVSNTSSSVSRLDRDEPASIPKAVEAAEGKGADAYGWGGRHERGLRGSATRSATRASANSTDNTAASLASLPCAMSKLFEPLLLSLHDSISERQDLNPERVKSPTSRDQQRRAPMS